MKSPRSPIGVERAPSAHGRLFLAGAIVVICVLLADSNPRAETGAIAASPALEGGASSSGCPGTKRGLVVSGGGARGAFQLGALWYLVMKAKCEFHAFAGVSVGALHAAVLAQAKDLSELEDQAEKIRKFWLDIKDDKGDGDVYRRRVFQHLLGDTLGSAIHFFMSESLYTAEPLGMALRDFLKRPPEKALLVGTVSLQDGEYREFEAHRVTHDHVLASATVPVLMPPVPITIEIEAEATDVKVEAGELGVRASFGFGRGMPCRVVFEELEAGCEVQWAERPLAHELNGTLLNATLHVIDGRALLERIRKALERGGKVSVKVSTNHQLIDGGLRVTAPIVPLLKRRPDLDHVFIVTTAPYPPESRLETGKLTKAKKIGERTIEIYKDAIYGNDFNVGYLEKLDREEKLEFLRYVRAVEQWKGKMREVIGPDIFDPAEGGVGPLPGEPPGLRVTKLEFPVIAPEQEKLGGFDSGIDYSQRTVRGLIKHGCERARDAMRGIFGDCTGVVPEGTDSR
ncbi:MAG: patatin-like phospholipase family protein [Chloroflexi bacterium]|nr:patatin-like phospholipase family protein [Chloroflexota bacterium]